MSLKKLPEQSKGNPERSSPTKKGRQRTSASDKPPREVSKRIYRNAETTDNQAGRRPNKLPVPGSKSNERQVPPATVAQDTKGVNFFNQGKKNWEDKSHRILEHWGGKVSRSTCDQGKERYFRENREQGIVDFETEMGGVRIGMKSDECE